MPRPLLTILAGGLVLALPGAARAAGEPIMPLSQVHAGMRCTVRSVLHGTTISIFDAEVLDIVDGQKTGDDSRILVRYSGPAIDATGVGPGFSGSPLTCPDAKGTPRVIGALSYGIGDYGNKVGLVTPIGEMLGQKVRPPLGAHRRPALLRRARPLEQLSLTGFSGPVQLALGAAARRAGRSVLAVPGGPATARFAPQPLIPGAALSVGLATGDFSAGAIGTITYRDGARLWAFGHPLDGAGRRSLFLQDAYVYTVVGNPIGSEESMTYKLAAPGHDLGTLSGDGPNAVAGTVGALPPSTLFTARVRDADTGHVTTGAARIADETDVGNPLGDSVLDLVAVGGTSSLLTRAFAGAPAAETGRMCAHFRLREVKAPITFCNRYVGSGVVSADVPAVVPGAAADDLAAAIGLVAAPDFSTFHVTRLRVDVSLARGLHQAFIRSASGPHSAARGARIRVTLRLRRYHGAAEVKHVRVRVPRTLRPGMHRLVLAGPANDSGDLTDVLAQILGAEGSAPDSTDASTPTTRAGLAHAIRALARYDGVSALFGNYKTGAHVLRDPSERISGAAVLHLHVR